MLRSHRHFSAHSSNPFPVRSLSPKCCSSLKVVGGIHCHGTVRHEMSGSLTDYGHFNNWAFFKSPFAVSDELHCLAINYIMSPLDLLSLYEFQFFFWRGEWGRGWLLHFHNYVNESLTGQIWFNFFLQQPNKYNWVMFSFSLFSQFFLSSIHQIM